MKTKGISIRFPANFIYKVLNKIINERSIIILATLCAVFASAYYYSTDQIINYGDAESHLNISKRVIHSLTPGLAQVGGIWLPLPHLLMVPFVAIEPLYRSGLAGSIVSGISFVVSCLYLFKTVMLFTRKSWVGFMAVLLFASNPNILYMQSTPMTEIPLIVFFIMSMYYFLRFLYDQSVVLHLVLAALFGFCATLSRYDGWFLVLIEAFCLILLYGRKRVNWTKLEGYLFLFSTLAFFGILMWLIWGYLILGDPLYFTNSQFSAKSQQNSWNARGELPAYHNPIQSVLYYTFTSMSNIGILLFFSSIIGFVLYLRNKEEQHRAIIGLLFMVPYIFYIVTLFMGQSVIFIPSLTPVSFEWRLFNVRYGIMMVPFAATFTAYLFSRLRFTGRSILAGLILAQLVLYGVGYSKVVTLDDGEIGLSHAKRPEAEQWIKANYDGGLVLMDDYARTISVVRSGIPMQQIIYIGNKPYWEESFIEPEKYATWIVMQRDDTVWNNILDNPPVRDRMYAHFEKVYTSEEILIFRKPQNEN